MCPLVPCFKLFGSADLHLVGVVGNGPDAVKRSGDAGRQDCWHVGTPGGGTAYVPSGDLDSRRDKSDLMTTLTSYPFAVPLPFLVRRLFAIAASMPPRP